MAKALYGRKEKESTREEGAKNVLWTTPIESTTGNSS